MKIMIMSSVGPGFRRSAPPPACGAPQAQLKKQLRKEVYGQILIGAVQKGNKAPLTIIMM